MKNKLSVSDLANLWKVYMIENLLIPIKIPMIQTCKDEEIKSALSLGLEISIKYVQKIAEFYEEVQHPIPKGFAVQDHVNQQAPALFTDNYYLYYINEMSKLGFRTLPQAIEQTENKELLKIWYEAFEDYKNLYNKSTEILKNKNLFPQPPELPIPKKIEFIKHNNYLGNWAGIKRPLNAEEILRVHGTAYRNEISKTLLIGLSKVTKDQEIKKFLERGIKNANKIIGDMHQVLINENLEPPLPLHNEVMDSTISPYSEKLILVHVAQMGSGAIGIYGSDLAAVFRKDLAFKFIKIIGEAILYGEDGMDLLIKRGWIESPPKNEI
ncbi:DUF3231 family protein [Neobacillus cucumis]|uniref:DUF3231 domain-containing protein n=1 Tax=Neobacillus cucumis TaxID=1740721 RepID=A0A2N5HSV6_9BACI|nr:DUF3231 family protein [Neobacillus cucumis]PLS08593.1 hypothetical protein CVD27_04125 [Neobacillus cucumis]